MRHAAKCLRWGWRRRAAKIEAGLRVNRARYSDRAAAEADGYVRALRFCADVLERALVRDARKGTP